MKIYIMKNHFVWINPLLNCYYQLPWWESNILKANSLYSLQNVLPFESWPELFLAIKYFCVDAVCWSKGPRLGYQLIIISKPFLSQNLSTSMTTCTTLYWFLRNQSYYHKKKKNKITKFHACNFAIYRGIYCFCFLIKIFNHLGLSL